MTTMLEKWRAMPVRTWNVRDVKFDKTFQMHGKTRGDVVTQLCERWMLTPQNVKDRAVISAVRVEKESSS